MYIYSLQLKKNIWETGLWEKIVQRQNMFLWGFIMEQQMTTRTFYNNNMFLKDSLDEYIIDRLI